MKLVKYDEINEKAYGLYITEWENTGEKIVPYASRRDGASFSDIMERWNFSETDGMYEKGFVPATLYFMVDEKQTIVGAIHLRHELNPYLKKVGGHIGYGIKPSCRHKGYGVKMLKLMLDEIEPYGINKVLVTCDDDNIASARTIEKNGGILENKLVVEGNLVRRYWIDLSIKIDV